MSTNGNQLTWPKKARKLASSEVRRFGLHPDVAGWLESEKKRRILVACSGGPDSVFMLCLLWVYAKESAVELIVAHYNHRWRGRFSDADAGFVREMAAGLGCVFVMDERPEKEVAFTETTARALRLNFLRRVALKYGSDGIAFGHQQNDILETQLQRLVRGVSSEGLAAPRPLHFFNELPTHIRPVLHISSSDIRMSLAHCAVPWCEDGSNEDTSIPRNALRHKVIPDLMAALGRDVFAGASRTRMLLAEEAEALDTIARERLPEAFAGIDRLDRNVLKAAPSALVRRAMTTWLQAHDLISSMSASFMDHLVKAIYSSKENNRLSAGSAFVVLNINEVTIEVACEGSEALEVCSFQAGEDVILSSGALLATELIGLDDVLRKRILEGEIDPAREACIAMDAAEPLQIRSWMPGDRFHPLGAPGNKKLKDWFIDRHVSCKERKLLPVVLIKTGEIVWVPGFPPAEMRRIHLKTTRALRLTYRPRDSISSI